MGYKPKSTEKSFASTDQAKYWNIDKNNGITPDMVYKSSKDKYWFNCENCPHAYQAKLNNISSENGTRCSYCSNKILCEDADCKMCFDKSFASSEMAIFWSDKNTLQPRMASRGSNKKYWIRCDKCPHTYLISMGNLNNGKRCSYCAKKILCEDVDCQMCFETSFASSKRALEWNFEKNEGLNPRDVFKSSGKRFWFNCKTCSHVWNPQLLYITQHNNWCPPCSSRRTEKLVRKIFETLYPNHLFSTSHPDFLLYVGGKNLELDGYNEELKLAFEYHGKQHYELHPFFHRSEKDFNEQQIRDNWKLQKTQEQGIRLVVIPYTHDYKDEDELRNFITTELEKYQINQI